MPKIVFHAGPLSFRVLEKNPGLNCGNSWGTHHPALIVASANPNTTPFQMLPLTEFGHRSRGKSRNAKASEKAIPVNRWYTVPAQNCATVLSFGRSKRPLNAGHPRFGRPFPAVRLSPLYQ